MARSERSENEADRQMETSADGRDRIEPAGTGDSDAPRPLTDEDLQDVHGGVTEPWEFDW